MLASSKINYDFRYKISEEVLCNYLARAVTISPIFNPLNLKSTPYIKQFILNTGAKYIQRAATVWIPKLQEYETLPYQKEFINEIHKFDSDVVFEACIFECLSKKVNEIPVPGWVFEDFGLPVEERCFSFDDICFPNGEFKNQWGTDTTVPDITQLETQMFFYFRACTYIKMGFEALHMGQVHLIGKNDKDWKCWTKLLNMIREFSKKYARRNFVFINAHTSGIIGSDGVLLFDFHADPCRPMADGSQEPHFPTEDNPQRCYLTNKKRGDFSTIYGRSIGGKTYSGWECEALPYLVEVDNYEDDLNKLNIPDPEDVRCWGMDEITWFANQPNWYRAEFLKYAYNWVKNEAKGKGFLALPCERLARFYNNEGKSVLGLYLAYNSKNHINGNNDEFIIKEIFNSI